LGSTLVEEYGTLLDLSLIWDVVWQAFKVNVKVETFVEHIHLNFREIKKPLLKVAFLFLSL